jgi:hypothetical protein
VTRESLGAAWQVPGFSFCFRRSADRNQRMPAALLKQPAAHRPTVSPRARPVTQGAVENGCVLVFFGFRPGFPSCQSKPSGATVTVCR